MAATALSRIIATKSATCSTCSGFSDPSLQVRMRVCARDTRILKYSQAIISGYEIHQFSGLTEAASPGITRACAHHEKNTCYICYKSGFSLKYQ